MRPVVGPPALRDRGWRRRAILHDGCRLRRRRLLQPVLLLSARPLRHRQMPLRLGLPVDRGVQLFVRVLRRQRLLSPEPVCPGELSCGLRLRSWRLLLAHGRLLRHGRGLLLPQADGPLRRADGLRRHILLELHLFHCCRCVLLLAGHSLFGLKGRRVHPLAIGRRLWSGAHPLRAGMAAVVVKRRPAAQKKRTLCERHKRWTRLCGSDT